MTSLLAASKVEEDVSLMVVFIILFDIPVNVVLMLVLKDGQKVNSKSMRISKIAISPISLLIPIQSDVR
jgi:hypothetical protein